MEAVTIDKNTKVVWLFGAPSSGKSTMMFGLAYKLKLMGYEVEISPETAKNFVWDESFFALKCQPYISSQQLWNTERLLKKVDFIITDSPFLLGAIYGPWYNANKYNEHFYKFLIEHHKSISGVNILLERDFAFEQNGRVQDENESYIIHNKIVNLLSSNNISYCNIINNTNAIKEVIDVVLEKK